MSRLSRGRSLLRAAMAGLSLGLLVGGLALGSMGAKRALAPPDCAGRTHEECILSEEIWGRLARWQLLAGGALVLMGTACGLLLRSSLKS